MAMKKIKVGETYYYEGTKSIVKILKTENLYIDFVFVEVVFSDGGMVKGNKGECATFLLNNKVIALWI